MANNHNIPAINVVITDGVRVANWDYPKEATIAQILKDFNFKPVEDTVLAGSKRSYNRISGDLSKIRLEYLSHERTPDGYQDRVRIILKSQKPQKKGDKANVR